MNKTITKNAVLNAVLTTAYIALIAFLLSNAENVFGQEDPKTFLLPTMMLLLFVLSAAITSFLVLARPVMWYLDGKKKEAVFLLIQTLATLFVILLITFVAVYLVSLK